MKNLKLVEKKIYLVNNNIRSHKHYCDIYRESCFDFVEVE